MEFRNLAKRLATGVLVGAVGVTAAAKGTVDMTAWQMSQLGIREEIASRLMNLYGVTFDLNAVGENALVGVWCVAFYAAMEAATRLVVPNMYSASSRGGSLRMRAAAVALGVAVEAVGLFCEGELFEFVADLDAKEVELQISQQLELGHVEPTKELTVFRISAGEAAPQIADALEQATVSATSRSAVAHNWSPLAFAVLPLAAINYRWVPMAWRAVFGLGQVAVQGFLQVQMVKQEMLTMAMEEEQHQRLLDELEGGQQPGHTTGSPAEAGPEEEAEEEEEEEEEQEHIYFEVPDREAARMLRRRLRAAGKRFVEPPPEMRHLERPDLDFAAPLTPAEAAAEGGAAGAGKGDGRVAAPVADLAALTRPPEALAADPLTTGGGPVRFANELTGRELMERQRAKWRRPGDK